MGKGQNTTRSRIFLSPEKKKLFNLNCKKNSLNVLSQYVRNLYNFKSNNPLNGASNENSLKLKERSLAARHSDAWVKILSHTKQG